MVDIALRLCYYNGMSIQTPTHHYNRSELDKFELFYERISDNRPRRHGRAKQTHRR